MALLEEDHPPSGPSANCALAIGEASGTGLLTDAHVADLVAFVTGDRRVRPLPAMRALMKQLGVVLVAGGELLLRRPEVLEHGGVAARHVAPLFGRDLSQAGDHLAQKSLAVEETVLQHQADEAATAPRLL
ncbi:hypothetical protein ACOZFM_28700 [Streptomyces arboris]|uniref:hypothetical protein n=1 Tax=Streptomyces arboris TaxID=2600619 RepID=UPI003BF61938